ncbi:malate dehydrogenase, cytoplasmic-like [Pomacea canaliculata]|uniref:malate dehydrogenase, cytoplasmic-like n=1 Tax=Pomacea canaliculata TaxID=400727 RepID=UPI000D73535A|nr:malate dehydrogenase, cytoplasmic-like [Pomacea canaliculata]
MSDVVKVCVTGAAGQIAYSLLYSIAKGDVFGPDQPLCLTLLDIAPMMGVLEGVVMELNDCAFPLLREIIPTADEKVAFSGVSAAFLVGAMPRREGMERKDLLAANVKIFKSQGQAIDQFANKDIKVLVVGNPANTNALICSFYAPSIPRENFSCMTRLDQNRAQAQIAARLGVRNDAVENVIIWGNHSSTQFPDVRHATVEISPGKRIPVYDAVKDDNYLKNEFVTTVQTRGAAVIKARKLSSAMSAAKAACDHMRDWWIGTQDNKWVSMGVVSPGVYGIEKGLMYSFPVRIQNKTWTIVEGLEINEFARKKMDATAVELKEEKDQAMDICKA